VRVLDTEVLVIGGGLAALRAALEAARVGARVTIVVKRKLGRCGSSAITSGGYAATHPDITPQDRWERHYADTLNGGDLLNDRRLARVLCEEAGARLQDLLALGAPFLRQNGHYYLSPSGDHSLPRVLVPVNMRGTDLTLPLREAVIAAGVTVLENAYVVDLIGGQEGVTGALVLDRDSGTLATVRAGAVVMGTGGAGRLFEVTSNPVDVVGDGFAIAYRLGAPLRDMEMIQFYPWRAIRPFRGSRVPIQPSTFVVGARLYNARGERFMLRYDPARGESTTRDVAARGIFDQIRQGLAVEGGVILDLQAVSDADFRSTNKKVIERLEPRGVHFRDVQFIIAPEAHFVMGGLVIDEHGRTPIPGLFACGEAAGGIHGANRLNSNALPDTQVFGVRAGQAAAVAARSRAPGAVDERPVRRWGERLAKARPDGVAAEALEVRRQELQRRMWMALGIVRSARGLREGVGYVTGEREALAGLRPRDDEAFETIAELEAMGDAAEAMLVSALHRTESRGAHFREDFPVRADARWLQTVLVRRTNGTPEVWTEPIDTSTDDRYLVARDGARGLRRIEGEFVE
jgi:fumarate reductase (CoM/CoB) subunit A